MLEAVGHPELPYLMINLSPASDRVLEHLKPAFVGATLQVIDASPFPRACPNGGGCVDLIAR
jgi:hypothetical protein